MLTAWRQLLEEEAVFNGNICRALLAELPSTEAVTAATQAMYLRKQEQKQQQQESQQQQPESQEDKKVDAEPVPTATDGASPSPLPSSPDANGAGDGSPAAQPPAQRVYPKKVKPVPKPKTMEEEVADALGFLQDARALHDALSPAFPKQPYYVTISQRVMEWGAKGEFPVKRIVLQGFEKSVSDEALAKVYSKTELVQQFVQTVSALLPSDEKADEASPDTVAAIRKPLKSLLDALTIRDLLTLLGLQCTLGSIDQFPPSLYTMCTSFNEQNDRGAMLSVGARALSKHCHRGQDKWWGDTQGNDAKKNKNAKEAMRKVFSDAVWVNLHTLPHEVLVFEVRCREGYGMRWSADGTFFRGFLEPQMEDGHEKGWKH